MAEISVIIPVYRTEKTLERCVRSVLDQKCDLEVLLIDDGSPDGSPALCDRLAREDPKIRVIHQENGGLSAARNRGIREAAGQWLFFVDSDDRLVPGILPALLERVRAGDGDMAVCGVIEEDENGRVLTRRLSEGGICGPEAAIGYLLAHGGGGDYMVNKLCRSSLFDGIRFPVGRHYEDAATSYRLMAACRRIVFTDLYGYYYFRHSDTITFSGSLGVHMDLLTARLEKWDFIREKMPKLEPLQKQEVIQTCAGLYERIYQAGVSTCAAEKQQVDRAFRQARKGAAYPFFSNRLTVLLLSLSPALYVRGAAISRRRKKNGQ